MFNIKKLANKVVGGNKSKKSKKQSPKGGNANVKPASCSKSNSKNSNVNVSECLPIKENLYTLKYKQESRFFAKDTAESAEIISSINSDLNNIQTRTSCLQVLEILIDSCSQEQTNKNILHWANSLLNIFMFPTSTQRDKETSCRLLLKVVSRLRPTQDAALLLTTLTNHIAGKSSNENEPIGDPLLTLKLMKEFLVSLPTLCGQHRGKYSKLLSVAISHDHPAVQELAAECLAMLPSAGGSGPSGQGHHQAWSAAFNKVLSDLEEAMTSLESDLPQNSNKELNRSGSLFLVVHRISGLVKTSVHLLNQPCVEQFELKRVLNIAFELLGIKMLSGGTSSLAPYVPHLHTLAFSILETLLSRYCELLSFHSSIIFEQMIQTLRKTSRKNVEDALQFCSLRKSVYGCLRLCFLHHIFPSTMIALKTVVELTLQDCKAHVETHDASKLKLSASSVKALSKKKKNSGKSAEDLQLQGADRAGPSDEEVDLCVAALGALGCLVTSDSKLLQLSVLDDDNTVNPIVSTEEGKRDAVLKILVTPVWRFVVALVRKLQGVWSVGDLGRSSRPDGLYHTLEVRVALYSLLCSLVSLPMLRDSGIFSAACLLIRAGSCSESHVEVQQICKQALMWLSFTVDCSRLSLDNPSLVTELDDPVGESGGQELNLKVPDGMLESLDMSATAVYDKKEELMEMRREDDPHRGDQAEVTPVNEVTEGAANANSDDAGNLSNDYEIDISCDIDDDPISEDEKSEVANVQSTENSKEVVIPSVTLRSVTDNEVSCVIQSPQEEAESCQISKSESENLKSNPLLTKMGKRRNSEQEAESVCPKKQRTADENEILESGTINEDLKSMEFKDLYAMASCFIPGMNHKKN